jgi:SNF2 family DNA or RNA helicase
MALKRCTECGGLDERITASQCQVHLRELNYLTFNTVVADECHRGKQPVAWTRALWEASKNALYRYGLTGTPIQDTLVDLWAILRFIAPQEYPTKTKFIDRFAESGYNMWGIFQVYGVRKGAEEEFHAGIDPRYRRMLKEVVLPYLPPILRENRIVEMKPAQRKAYKQMLKDTIAELDGGPLVAANPLSRATRLLQFASAYAELDIKELDDGRVESKVRLSNPSCKIEAFLDDYDVQHYGKNEWSGGDYGDSSIIVFAQSRQLIDLLHEALEKQEVPHGMITGSISTDDRQKNIDAFQAGETKLILVTIDAGGVGLTLTAADTMIFLQRHWSSTAMKQAEGRAHRAGSEIHEHVTIVNYIAENTIEEQQLVRIGEKYARAETILRDQEMLKKLLTDAPIDVDTIPEYDGSADDEETLDV